MNIFWVLILIFSGFFGVLGGFLFVPLLVDGQIIRSDILSSLGTWLGSIGTVGTLLFLSVQYRKEQKSKKDQEIKQGKIWAEQKETLDFQKLQTHKALFYDQLLYLEGNSDFQKIAISNKGSLYYKVFPKNNFLSVEFNLLNSDVRFFDELDYKFKKCFNILKKSSKREECIELYEFPILMGDICEALNITFEQNHIIGDVIIVDELYFNILRPYSHIETLLSVYNALRHFSCLKPIIFKPCRGYGLNITIVFLKFLESSPSYKLNNGPLDVLAIANDFYQYMLCDENKTKEEVDVINFACNKFGGMYNNSDIENTFHFLQELEEKLGKLEFKNIKLEKLKNKTKESLDGFIAK